jgi:hypothetical protein
VKAEELKQKGQLAMGRFWVGDAGKGGRAVVDDRALRKEETANAVSPLMGSAIDALLCAAP